MSGSGTDDCHTLRYALELDDETWTPVQKLRRVMDESTRQWVYRPVDEASGDVITKEAFEARRREERRLRAEADPRKTAEFRAERIRDVRFGSWPGPYHSNF